MEPLHAIYLWLALVALIWQPMGVLIGHFWRGRALEGGLLGLSLGPIGIGLIPLLADHRRPPVRSHNRPHPPQAV
jgi:hypothetical protein